MTLLWKYGVYVAPYSDTAQASHSSGDHLCSSKTIITFVDYCVRMKKVIAYNNFVTMSYNKCPLVLRTVTTSVNAGMQPGLDGIVNVRVHMLWNIVPFLRHFSVEMRACQPWANHPCQGPFYGVWATSQQRRQDDPLPLQPFWDFSTYKKHPLLYSELPLCSESVPYCVCKVWETCQNATTRQSDCFTQESVAVVNIFNDNDAYAIWCLSAKSALYILRGEVSTQ